MVDPCVHEMDPEPACEVCQSREFRSLKAMILLSEPSTIEMGIGWKDPGLKWSMKRGVLDLLVSNEMRTYKPTRFDFWMSFSLSVLFMFFGVLAFTAGVKDGKVWTWGFWGTLSFFPSLGALFLVLSKRANSTYRDELGKWIAALRELAPRAICLRCGHEWELKSVASSKSRQPDSYHSGG